MVTVNARQNAVVGSAEFQRLLDLADAMLNRPAAFDGGTTGAGAAPDVIVLQEMRQSNLDILEKVMRQRSDFRYDLVGATFNRAKFLINADRIALEGEPTSWEDPCYATVQAQSHDDPGVPDRVYQWARFVEKETSTPFVVAGVHFSKHYAETGEQRCLERNVEELRRVLEPVAALPTFIAGDFNRKATQPQPPCDPEETGTPLEWWSTMTAPVQGVPYTDAVRAWHRAGRRSMKTQWTHEHRLHHPVCNATYMQHRLDYIFSANVRTASASADHPGWAGPQPGTRSRVNPQYSDHRFVAGRFQIAGPAPARRPAAVPLSGGRISLTWAAPKVPVAEWLVYRSVGARPYSLLATVPGATTAYEDSATNHGRNYRYAIAAVDGAGAQGRESLPAWMRADARGPQVTRTRPPSGARGVERGTSIAAMFDERVAPASVARSTMDLYLDGRKVCGRVRQVKPSVVMLDPCNLLRAKKEYRVVVRPVTDALGNRGTSHSWRFVTR